MGRIFTFLIYSFIYLCVGGAAIGHYLGVSPFVCFSFATQEVFINPFIDWYTLYIQFQYDNWAINSGHNLLIFFVFLFFFPLWIGLWFWVRRIHFGRFLFAPFYRWKAKRLDEKTQKIAIKKSSMGRPQALPHAGFGNLSLTMPLEPATQTEPTSAPPSATQVADSLGTAQSVFFIDEALKEEIRQLGGEHGYDLFENVRLEKYSVPLVLATDSRALLMTFLTENREWIADEDAVDDDTEPTWFSAEGLIPSPFYQMKEAAAVLRQKEPDSEIVPVVVICEGTVLNGDVIKPTWQEQQGFVALWRNGKGEDLPVLVDLLPDKQNDSTESSVLRSTEKDIKS